MKQNMGELSEADLKARRRFWNKKGFFGEPTRKQLERDSMKMQKLVKAMKTFFPRKLKKYAPPLIIQSGVLKGSSLRICTQYGTLANQISIMQYQPLKFFRS